MISEDKVNIVINDVSPITTNIYIVGDNDQSDLKEVITVNELNRLKLDERNVIIDKR